MLLHLRLIILHGFKNKGSKLDRHYHFKQADKCKQYSKIQIKLKCIKSKGSQAIVNQMAIETVKVVLMAIREADMELTTGTSTASPREEWRQRHSRPALKQSSCNWNITDMYVEFLKF